MTALQQCPHCSGAIPPECHAVSATRHGIGGTTRESRTFCDFCGILRYALWAYEDDRWRLDGCIDYIRRTEPDAFRRELEALESLVAA